jgi:uncharacterized protein (DUF1697 family)
MPRWIGLFRAINVGGNNLLPMKQLVASLEALKCQNVKTYIQSGNVVFDASAKNAESLARKIARRIEQDHGFLPKLLLLSVNELQTALQNNPFPEASEDPKAVHVYFLEQPAADPDLSALDALKTSSESYELSNRVYYLLAPDGIGRSKLAAAVERKLGVAVTARNYRTVQKLAALALEP